MKAKFFILALILCAGLWVSGLVFGGTMSFKTDVRYVWSVAQTVYIDHPSAAKDVVVFSSNTDISSGKIVSSCNIESTYVARYQKYYFFLVDYSKDALCDNGYISFSLNSELFPHATGKLQLASQQKLLTRYLDYSDNYLKILREKYEVEKDKNSVYKDYNGENIIKYFSLFQGQRKYLEANYMHSFVSGILGARAHKYISPVPGKHISNKPSKIPNAARPYRAAYTDGIHHGWDIDGDFGDDTVALDDGLIVRVVEEFNKSDFSRIEYAKNLSEEQKLKNLDVLRGKQVWLKTMKGEVVFYSHLDKVAADLKEWMFVKKWKFLGTVGVSGVPQDDYDDYHLHFAIMKNPYNNKKAGSYDFGDYMAWDWLTRWLGREATIQRAKEIFTWTWK